MTAITIRRITDASGLRAVEDLQQEVWGASDRELIPVHQLVAAVAAGGVVLGAFGDAGALLGFCYGLIGLRDGQLFFYSHMAAVRPEHQNHGLGFSLKCAQRQAALDLGLDLMMWTYDPLQSMNAAFNFRKLGATAHRYLVNYYGEMPDEINRGMESDRFEVDWHLRAPRVEAALAGPASTHFWPPVPAALQGLPRHDAVVPGDPNLTLSAPLIRVEIPRGIGDLKVTHPDVVLAWRLASREAFTHYFGRGYAAIDFVGQRNAPTGFYVLEHQSPGRVPA